LSAAPENDTSGLWRLGLITDAIGAPALGQALEDIADALSSFEIKPGGPWRIDALFTRPPDRAELATRLALAAATLGRPAPDFTVEALPAIDWVAENQRSFPPLAIARFYVFGSHVTAPPPVNARRIALDASIAFGSGEHATTRGCLLAIDATAARRRPRAALDLGCGSAILAIALARTGCRRVTAADIDRDSVRLAAENVVRNGVRARVSTRVSDGFQRLHQRRGFDLVVANILARPLKRLARELAAATAPGGTLVLSGLLAEQERELRATYCGHRLAFMRRIAIDGWHTLVFKRRALPGSSRRPN
jgi:ribosomal protein L11 methyltransferase